MNNLDNFYNKKLQNREFEFKESYWEDAERLIIEDEKKRRTGRYFWFFGLLLVFVIGGAVFWIGKPSDGKVELATTFSKTEIGEETSIAKTESQITENSKDQSSKSENNFSELSVIASKSGDQNLSNSDNSIVKTNSPIEEITQNKRSENSNSSTVYNTNPDSSFEPKSEISKSETIVSQIDKNTKDQFQNTVIENSEEKSVIEEFSNTSLLAPISTLSNEIDDSEYPKLKKISIPKTRNFKLGLTASGLFYPASNNEQAWIGASFGAVGQYKFLKNLSLNAELLYTNRTGTFGVTSKSEQTLFGFGKQTIEYSQKPKSMHFFELPVYVEYHLGRHGIEGGFSFSYLAGIRGDIEKESSLQPWERTNGNKSSSENYFSGWISKDGFNSFTTSVLLGYKYSINQNFELGFRSAYRFGELVKLQDSSEKVLLESGPVNFNISATWYFLK